LTRTTVKSKLRQVNLTKSFEMRHDLSFLNSEWRMIIALFGDTTKAWPYEHLYRAIFGQVKECGDMQRRMRRTKQAICRKVGYEVIETMPTYGLRAGAVTW
jgi:hypothetical protein